METLNIVKDCLSVFLSTFAVIATCVTLVIALKEYFSTKREKAKIKHSKAMQDMAMQIIAFYCEEQEAIKWIMELSGEKYSDVKEELRNRAVLNEKNVFQTKPAMTPSKAKDFIID